MILLIVSCWLLVIDCSRVYTAAFQFKNYYSFLAIPEIIF
jgi:hypothetical protein